MKIEGTPLLEKTLEAQAKTVVHVGGSGSSKSYSMAQAIVTKLLSEQGKRFAVLRKTLPACKRTAYAMIIDILDQGDMYFPQLHNKSDNTYRYNKNTIWFLGLDDVRKMKSTNLNYVWLEEADEFTYDDYMILKLLCRHPNDLRNHLYLSLNPVDENGWIPTILMLEDDVEIIQSTYKDNPFLESDYRKYLNSIGPEAGNYYRVYKLGLWGSLENVIYPDYEVVDDLPGEYQAMAYGLDFGYVNETALVKVCIIDREIYLQERIYKRHLTNSDLIQLLSHEERGDIYADDAEPDRIEEIFRAGYNIYPAMKDVQLGIDLCKRQKLKITKDSVNLLKEIRGYQRKVDKAGNVLEEPVKFHDHLMDAMRYVIYGLTDRFGFATQVPYASRVTEVHRFK